MPNTLESLPENTRTEFKTLVLSDPIVSASNGQIAASAVLADQIQWATNSVAQKKVLETFTHDNFDLLRLFLFIVIIIMFVHFDYI